MCARLLHGGRPVSSESKPERKNVASSCMGRCTFWGWSILRERRASDRTCGLGVLLLAVWLVGVGWLVRRAAGRQLLHWWNQSVARFPVTGRIYSALSQVVQSVLGSKEQLFRRTVLVPYPTDGLWAVAFVTNDEPIEFARVVGEPCVNVFIPTTPNPTSGFMLVVPVRRIREVNLSVEDGMKLVISAGALDPGGPAMVGRGGLDLETLLKDSIG